MIIIMLEIISLAVKSTEELGTKVDLLGHGSSNALSTQTGEMT